MIRQLIMYRKMLSSFFLNIYSAETVDTGGVFRKPGAKPEVLKHKKLHGNMERGLHERDRVGVEDFVLLEDFRSESSFISNLKKRFEQDLIYVSDSVIKNKNSLFFHM